MEPVHRQRTLPATCRLVLRPAAVAASLLLLVGCGGDDDADRAVTTTTISPTTAPIPTPGGQAVEDLDACTLIDEPRLASYLDEVEAPGVLSTSADATEIASVCGWFVEDRDEVEQPERVLLRVEPLQEDGNVVCDPPEFAEVDDLELDEGTGWATTGSPVETASVVGEWCAYLAAPATTGAGLTATRDATVDLLAEVHDALPR